MEFLYNVDHDDQHHYDGLTSSDSEEEIVEPIEEQKVIIGGNLEKTQLIENVPEQIYDMTKQTEQMHNIKFVQQIAGDDRWTRDVLTIYNATAAIAYRASQIEKSHDSKHYILDEDLDRLRVDNQHLNIILDSALKIAFVEYLTNRSPLLVYRDRSDGSMEVWRVNDLIKVQLNNITLDILFKK